MGGGERERMEGLISVPHVTGDWSWLAGPATHWP
jgi:hypothetical protein